MTVDSVMCLEGRKTDHPWGNGELMRLDAFQERSKR